MSRVFVLFVKVIVAVGERESGGPGGCRVGPEARFFAPSRRGTLASPKASLGVQGYPQCGGHTAKQKDVAPGRPRGILGRASRAILLKIPKEANPRVLESQHSGTRWGKLTSAHLTLEAGPVGVSRFKFENQLEPV